MTRLLVLAADMASDAVDASDPAGASAAFHAAAVPHGVSYLQTRVYQRPSGILTSARHWAAGGVIARYAPVGWEGSVAFDYVCFSCNPLLEAIRAGRSLYRFSDFAPRTVPSYGTYWEAMGEARIGDAVCASVYGAERRIATLHVGFADADVPGDTGRAVQLASLLVAEHLMSLAEPVSERACPLTDRERDSLALVAEGKSDWEISMILGIAQTTARFHVDNARRKLNAVSRAHAVAKLMAHGWF